MDASNLAPGCRRRDRLIALHQATGEFTTARLATGAQFIRDMIVDAWLASATGMVGYPMVSVRDIETGRVRATRELTGAD